MLPKSTIHENFCPIVTGTLENLQYLVEAGISVTSNSKLQEEGQKLLQNLEIPEVHVIKDSSRYGQNTQNDFCYL